MCKQQEHKSSEKKNNCNTLHRTVSILENIKKAGKKQKAWKVRRSPVFLNLWAIAQFKWATELGQKIC